MKIDMSRERKREKERDGAEIYRRERGNKTPTKT